VQVGHHHCSGELRHACGEPGSTETRSSSRRVRDLSNNKKPTAAKKKWKECNQTKSRKIFNQFVKIGGRAQGYGHMVHVLATPSQFNAKRQAYF
jgi:hypothetical protein